MAERSQVVYWALTGTLLFAGFYLLYYGELPHQLLLAGTAMAGVGIIAFGGRKIWAMALGIPVAFSIAFLLNIIFGW